MKRILIALALMFAGASSALAQSPAGIPLSVLEGGVRTQPHFIPQVVINTATASRNALGLDGAIVELDISGDQNAVITSTMGAISYPAALRLILVDGGGSGGIATANVTLEGLDPRGYKIGEIVAVTETAGYSTKIYSKLTRVVFRFTTAIWSANAGDRLRIVMSDRIGLPMPVRSTLDIDSICRMNATNLTLNGCGFLASCTTSSFTRNPTVDYIDIDSCALPSTVGSAYTTAVAQDHAVMIRYRASTQ